MFGDDQRSFDFGQHPVNLISLLRGDNDSRECNSRWGLTVPLADKQVERNLRHSWVARNRLGDEASAP